MKKEPCCGGTWSNSSGKCPYSNTACARSKIGWLALSCGRYQCLRARHWRCCVRVGSLFSGCGGMDLGLERAGMDIAWQVEIDPYCSRILQKHWPDVWHWDDVKTFPPEPVDFWWVDLIAGGFPCQDISFMGKGAGIEGARSGLWAEYARIVRVLRPRYILVENVAALLVRGMGRVIGDLAEIGYDAEWDCIPAAAAGAPYLRDRVFLFAHHTNSINVNPLGTSPGLVPKADAEGTGNRQGSDTNRNHAQKRVFGSGGKESLISCPRWGTDQSGVDRTLDGVLHRVDRLKALGNAVVPQVAEWIGRRILATTEST